MTDDDPGRKVSIARIRSALAFLRDEADRLDFPAASSAIIRVLVILEAQSKLEQGPAEIQ